MRFVFTLCAVLVLHIGQARADDDPSGYRYVAEALAPGVHLLRQRTPFHLQPRGNVVVIEQSDGVVLVDSGGSHDGAEEVAAFVRGVTAKPVTVIILTHWHGDHVLGVERLLRDWPHARVIATEQTRATLARPQLDRFMPGDNAEPNAALQSNIAGAVAFFTQRAEDQAESPEARAAFATAADEMRGYGEAMSRSRRLAPTEGFAQWLVLDDAHTPIEVRHLGAANTDGDAIVWLPRQRVLVSGDVVVAPIPFGFGSSPGAWIETLDALAAYDFAVLAPGHGAAMRGRDYLQRLRALLVDVQAQAEAAGADAPRFELSRHREAITGGDAWLARWFDVYFTQAITPTALAEARGEPIAQVPD